jgi:hypothetical protein
LNKLGRLTWSRVYRDGDFIRLLCIAQDNDNIYGKKWTDSTIGLLGVAESDRPQRYDDPHGPRDRRR